MHKNIDKVKYFSSEISSLKKISKSEVRIIFAGRVVSDHQKLEDLDIQSQTVVHAFQGRCFQARMPLSRHRLVMEVSRALPLDA